FLRRDRHPKIRFSASREGETGLSRSGTGKSVRSKIPPGVKASLSFTGVYYAHPVFLDSYRVVGATLFDASLLNS
ncbi:hypothetical protein, partial [Mesorhizobium sp. M1E.F.Ca.ET.063.01.1.1]|uniref:hypothetical protein n=1 Tax=Mesorhizobium sp. M1E.F.Ca.ET.063.01.1.1 TaxID=2496750 RepID=UPI001AECB469